MYQYYDDQNNVTVVYICLPVGVNECVTLNEDDSYTIFISACICEQKQREAYKHALRHIKGNDFWKADVNDIERKAHGE